MKISVIPNNYVGYNLYEEQKKLQLRQHALEIAEDTIQNMGTHGSITGKTMTRIICFDHITTATTPFPNL